MNTPDQQATPRLARRRLAYGCLGIIAGIAGRASFGGAMPATNADLAGTIVMICASGMLGYMGVQILPEILGKKPAP